MSQVEALMSGGHASVADQIHNRPRRVNCPERVEGGVRIGPDRQVQAELGLRRV